VRQSIEHQRDRAGRRIIERQHAVRRDARQQSASVFARKQAAREAFGRPKRAQAETRECDRMRWPAQRLEYGLFEARPRVDHASDEISIRGGVAAEALGGPLDGSIDARARRIIERMREHHRRFDPLQAVSGERQRAEKRRDHGERMDSRANVMNEAGRGELGRPHAAANRRLGFEHHDLAAGLRDHDRRRQAIRPRSHDDRVGPAHATRIAYA
jgi:hypothetical protein